MPDVFLREHKGVKIYVGYDGKFYATVGKGLVSRKDLRSVEREIEKALPRSTAWPGRKVITVSDRSYDGIDTCQVHTVVSVRTDKKRGYSATGMVADDGKDLRYGHYYSYDAGAGARLNDLIAQITALVAEKERILKSLESVHPYTITAEIDKWEAEQAKQNKETEVADQGTDAGT